MTRTARAAASSAMPSILNVAGKQIVAITTAFGAFVDATDLHQAIRPVAPDPHQDTAAGQLDTFRTLNATDLQNLRTFSVA